MKVVAVETRAFSGFSSMLRKLSLSTKLSLKEHFYAIMEDCDCFIDIIRLYSWSIESHSYELLMMAGVCTFTISLSLPPSYFCGENSLLPCANPFGSCDKDLFFALGMLPPFFFAC